MASQEPSLPSLPSLPTPPPAQPPQQQQPTIDQHPSVSSSATAAFPLSADHSNLPALVTTSTGAAELPPLPLALPVTAPSSSEHEHPQLPVLPLPLEPLPLPPVSTSAAGGLPPLPDLPALPGLPGQLPQLPALPALPDLDGSGIFDLDLGLPTPPAHILATASASASTSAPPTAGDHSPSRPKPKKKKKRAQSTVDDGGSASGSQGGYKKTSRGGWGGAAGEGAGSRPETFLRKLWKLLHHDPADVTPWMRWDSTGRLLIIPNEKDLVEYVCKVHFAQKGITSFNKQMNNWDFKRHSRSQRDLAVIAKTDPGVNRQTRIWYHTSLHSKSTWADVARVGRHEDGMAKKRRVRSKKTGVLEEGAGRKGRPKGSGGPLRVRSSSLSSHETSDEDDFDSEANKSDDDLDDLSSSMSELDDDDGDLTSSDEDGDEEKARDVKGKGKAKTQTTSSSTRPPRPQPTKAKASKPATPGKKPAAAAAKGKGKVTAEEKKAPTPAKAKKASVRAPPEASASTSAPAAAPTDETATEPAAPTRRNAPRQSVSKRKVSLVDKSDDDFDDLLSDYGDNESEEDVMEAEAETKEEQKEVKKEKVEEKMAPKTTAKAKGKGKAKEKEQEPEPEPEKAKEMEVEPEEVPASAPPRRAARASAAASRAAAAAAAQEEEAEAQLPSTRSGGRTRGGPRPRAVEHPAPTGSAAAKASASASASTSTAIGTRGANRRATNNGQKFSRPARDRSAPYPPQQHPYKEGGAASSTTTNVYNALPPRTRRGRRGTDASVASDGSTASSMAMPGDDEARELDGDGDEKMQDGPEGSSAYPCVLLPATSGSAPSSRAPSRNGPKQGQQQPEQPKSIVQREAPKLKGRGGGWYYPAVAAAQPAAPAANGYGQSHEMRRGGAGYRGGSQSGGSQAGSVSMDGGGYGSNESVPTSLQPSSRQPHVYTLPRPPHLSSAARSPAARSSSPAMPRAGSHNSQLLYPDPSARYGSSPYPSYPHITQTPDAVHHHPRGDAIYHSEPRYAWVPYYSVGGSPVPRPYIHPDHQVPEEMLDAPGECDPGDYGHAVEGEYEQQVAPEYGYDRPDVGYDYDYDAEGEGEREVDYSYAQLEPPEPRSRQASAGGNYAHYSVLKRHDSYGPATVAVMSDVRGSAGREEEDAMEGVEMGSPEIGRQNGGGGGGGWPKLERGVSELFPDLGSASGPQRRVAADYE
ncbi:hypothetical protein JCM5296_002971 [Sporobolomyces johnsonii]